jgi:6-phosphogluconate dehydrogenase
LARRLFELANEPKTFGMAANLVKAGHDVTVYNRTRAKAEALVAQGPYPK